LPDRLLDSNAVSALMAADPRMEEYLAGGGARISFYTSAVVAGELEFGIARLEKGRKRRELARALETVLGTLADVLTIGFKTARRYGGLKSELWRQGRPMGENDLWIAASALEHRLVLVTSDEPFRDVPGLDVENWREPRRF
jgi:tRNA(fMet)-specific endonuclease VapC